MSRELDREFYFTGLPIKTKFGNIRFLTYLEYLQHLSDLRTMSLNTLHIYYYYKKILESTLLKNEEQKEATEVLATIKEQSLYEIVLDNPSFFEAYCKIFKLVIDKEEKIEEIFADSEVFMQTRALIMDMNFIQEDEVNPNEEIQKYIDMAKESKAKNAGSQSFSDIVSSVVVSTGMDYTSVFNMTVLQLYAAYYRIAAIKDFDVSALFATVSEKQKIESWHKHINLFEKEKEGMSMEQFNTNFGSLF